MSDSARWSRIIVRTFLGGTLTILGLVAFGGPPATASPSTTLYVNAATDSVSGVTDCASSGNTDCGIDDAIAAFNADTTVGDADTIDFSSAIATFTVGTPTTIHNTTSGISLSIEGNGPSATAVSGDNQNEVFDIGSGQNVTISELTIEDGDAAPNGGGIYNGGTLTVDDSTLSDNTAMEGGAIFNGGTLTVSNSTLSDNTVAEGGGAILNGGGTLTISESTLSGNSATFGGGIENIVGTLTVSDSTLSGNSDSSLGGAILNDGVATIVHATLSGNSTSGGGHGGAIDNNHTLTLTSSIVANSGAGLDCSGSITDGGYNLDDDGSCGLSGTSLSDTPAGLDPAGLQNNGGPTQTIDLASGSAAIDAVTSVSDCTGSDQAGTPWSTPCDIGAAPVLGVTFYVNAATDSVSGVTDCASSGNTDCGIDDAIAAFNVDTTVGDADTIDFSSAIATFTVGPTTATAIGNTTSDITLSIEGNGPGATAVSGDNQSEVFDIDLGQVTISELTIEDGNAVGAGGGIDNDGTLTVSDCTLSDNTAEEGAGIFNDGTMTVNGSTLSDNTATAVGGGINNLGGTLTVNNSTLSGNSAHFYGGGIFNNGSATIVHATLSGNVADAEGLGGGIKSIGTLSIVASIVANSGAALGCSGTITDGGYNLDDDASCGFSGTSLSDTPADFDPVGLGNNGGPTETIALEPGSAAINAVTSPSDCTGNDQAGTPWPTSCDIGAVQAVGPALPFGSTTFYVNSATDSGATNCTSSINTDCGIDDAIAAFNADTAVGYADTIDFSSAISAFTVGTTTAIDSTAPDDTLSIVGNGSSATAVSGNNHNQVFDIGAGEDVTISALTIEDGHAQSGGGIQNKGNLILSGSTLSDNTATLGGGGIYSDDGTLTVNDSTLSGNTSPHGGGGILSLEGTLAVNDSTLSGNTSPGYFGGGIDNNGGTLTVTDSTLSGNTANIGGGIYNGGTATLTHATLSGNSVMHLGIGGGIYNGGTVTLTASIVANSGAGLDCHGTVIAAYDLDDDGSCGFSGTSLSDTPAGLDPAGLENNGGATETIALVSGSRGAAAVTSGSDCTGNDQSGAPWATPCNIGAVHTTVSGTAPPTPPVTPPPAATVTLNQGSPTSATVADGAGYSGQLSVTNATGTTSYGETVSEDSGDVVVGPSGTISAVSSLAPGTYAVGGTDVDTNGDTGTWAYILTVLTATPTTPTPTSPAPPTSTPPTSTPPPLPTCASSSGTAAFVCALYEDLLGRAPDAGGLSAFGGQLSRGTSRGTVAGEILHSTEYRTALITSYYRDYLGRPPDAGGLATFLTILGTGSSDETVQADILGSTEFFDAAGRTDDGFLAALYEDLLGRAPDAGGLSAFGGQLSRGTSRGTVAGEILHSTEYRTALITSYYRDYLRRAPDADGLATFLGLLDHGAPDRTVQSDILGSAEFLAAST